MTGVGPGLPIGATQRSRQQSEHTGCAPNVATKAAHDPKGRFSADAERVPVTEVMQL
jgi:hypothetical protein